MLEKMTSSKIMSSSRWNAAFCFLLAWKCLMSSTNTIGTSSWKTYAEITSTTTHIRTWIFLPRSILQTTSLSIGCRLCTSRKAIDDTMVIICTTTRFNIPWIKRTSCVAGGRKISSICFLFSSNICTSFGTIASTKTTKSLKITCCRR